MHNKRSCQATKFCNAKIAHADVEAICRELRLAPPLRDAIEIAALKLIHARAAGRSDSVARLKRRRARLVQQEMELTQSFVEGRIKPDTFEQLGTQLRTEIDAVRTELENTSVDKSARLCEAVRELLLDAEAIWQLFEMLDVARQAELLSGVFEVVVLGPKGVAGYSLRQPFAALFEAAPRLNNIDDDGVRHLTEKLIESAETLSTSGIAHPDPRWAGQDRLSRG